MNHQPRLWPTALRLVALVLLLTAASCAPFQPAEGAADGVTLTETDGVYTLTANPPVERAFLRFPGDNVTVEHDGCSIVKGAAECILGAVSTVSIAVGGTVTLPPDRPAGVVCRDECYALYLTPD